MTRRLVEIVAPKHGLHEGEEFSRQPALTTPLSKNMRTQQSTTLRLRVGTRAGYLKWNARSIVKNRLAFTEDLSHFRDTSEGIEPYPTDEGWMVQVTGAKSLSAVADGTLGPDGASAAYLVKQLVGSGSNRAELVQNFDVNNPPSTLNARPGSTFLRTAGELFFSIYLKASDATTSALEIRQGTAVGAPRTRVLITWTAGVPSLAQTTDGAGTHSNGFTEEGDGWYRIWVALAWAVGFESSAPYLRCALVPNQTDALARGLYAWGAQLEVLPVSSTGPTRYEAVLGKNAPLGKLKGAALTTVQHIQRKLDYRKKTPMVPTSSFSTPSKQAAQAIVYDRQRNRYVLEPQAVVKYSAKGELVFSIPVPIDDPLHVCQALHLDEVDQIYVGVTSGGNHETARLFCFRQGPDVVGGRVREDSFHLHWSVTTRRYVTAIGSLGGVLYTLQDDPSRRASACVTYEALDLKEPLVGLERPVPYPSGPLAVKADGSFVTGHITSAKRGLDPTSNGTDALGPWPTAVGWQPEVDFAGFSDLVWCDIDSEFVNGRGRRTVDDFDHGGLILDWLDVTGKARDLFKASDKSPTVNARGINGVPGIDFNGIDQALTSEPNPGTDETNLDLHRTIFPSYDGAKFTAFIVYRPAYEATQGCVIGQSAVNDASPSTDPFLALCSNRQAGNTISLPSRGHQSFFNHTDGTGDPASGTDAHPPAHQLEAGGLVNFCVATIRVGTAAGDSLVRFNGTATDAAFISKALAGMTATSVGKFQTFGFFKGTLFKILVYNSIVSLADIELHEGYLANRYGGQGRLDAAHLYKITPAAVLSVPSNAPLSPGKANPNDLNHRSTILAKFAPGGDLKWTLVNLAGVGYALALDSSGNIVSFGEYDTSETGAYAGARGTKGWVRRVTDLGDSAAQVVGVGDWSNNMARSGATSVSNAFSDAFWAKTTVTIGSNTGTDPLGGAQADTLDATGALGTVLHDFLAADLADGSDYTFSVFLRADTAPSVRLSLAQLGGTGSTQIDFAFATRTATPVVAGTARRHNWNVEELLGGWFRLQVSLDFKLSDSGTLRATIIPDASGGVAQTFAWGAMMERNRRASDFFNAQGEGKHNQPPAAVSSTLPRIAVDSFGNVFIPGPWPTPTSLPTVTTLFTARVYDKDLYLLGDIDIGSLATNDLRPGRAVAVNPEPPSYKDNNPGLARNLAGYTQNLADAYWGKAAVSVSASATRYLAPDGSRTAELVTDTSLPGEGALQRSFQTELDDGEVYTASVYLALQADSTPATQSRLVLEHLGGSQSTSLLIQWNVAARRPPLAVLSSVGVGVHTFELEPAGNGFFRFSVSVTYSAAMGALRLRLVPDASPASILTVKAWGMQLERGTAMTPYQKVAGRYNFAPAPLEGLADPVALVDTLTLVTNSDDVESASTSPLTTVHEVALVESDPNGLPARASKTVAIARGSLIVVDRVGEAQVPRGGSSCLDQNARYISTAALYQRVFATDGARAVVYEPHVDGRVRPYVAKTGEVPEGVELLSAWGGRLVAARTRDNPHAWFMSALEAPFDWDYFTPPLSSDKAVFATTSRAGECPDIINAIIPYDQQGQRRVLFGGDRTIWELRGDPLSAGAQWSEVAKNIGIAFGDRSHCITPDGVIYFFMSRGGLYRLIPGGSPESLTTETIERRLRDIDLEQYYVELYWNWREEGVHIYVVPYGSPTAIVQHFFWGRRFNEWRNDEFASALVQPTAGVVLDGDLSKDRSLLFVNGNLNVLQWKEGQRTDDGLPIVWRERMGPFDIGGDLVSKWNELTVCLAEDSVGCRFDLYGAGTADEPGPSRAFGQLGPGRNPRRMLRARGSKFWLDLSSDVPGETASFEEGGVWVSSGGRVR